MSLQTLIISVLVTCITVGATFFYFRNRIQRTEQKVDLMFSLIQEHENNNKLRQQFQPSTIQGGMSMGEQHGQFQQHEAQSNELINISEDEVDSDDEDSDYDSDDSAEVSDNEDKLQINDDDGHENLEDTVKTISLSLDGAETTASSEVKLDDMQNLIEHSIDENKQDIINKVFEHVDITKIEGETSLNTLEITEINDDDDDLDQINLSDEDENPDDKTIKTISGGDSTDYSKLTAKKLKELAKEKGLEAKGLKKKALVELLSSSQ